MSHQTSLGSSPKTNQGPEARNMSKIWRWIHSLANKAYLLFGAPGKALEAPPAMCSYDCVLTFSWLTKDISLFFVLKGALPNGLNCRSVAPAPAIITEQQSQNPNRSLFLSQASLCPSKWATAPSRPYVAHLGGKWTHTGWFSSHSFWLRDMSVQLGTRAFSAVVDPWRANAEPQHSGLFYAWLVALLKPSHGQ